jgi:thymidine phosphorylase
MQSIEKAKELASSIINTAAAANLKTNAIITDMNECLGETAGNALEIAESMAYLRNDRRESRLDEVVMALTSEMLIVTGMESDRAIAQQKTEAAVTSGKAAEIFDRMVQGLGGPVDFVETCRMHLPQAAHELPVFATDDGYLATVDAFAVGNAIIELGGGRRALGDTLDLSVGLSGVAPIGSKIGKDRPLAIIHASSEDTAKVAAEMIRSACSISETPPDSRPVIYEKMSGDA